MTEKFHVNGRSSLDVSSMRERCLLRHGRDKFNSGGTTFVTVSQDENTHVRSVFFFPSRDESHLGSHVNGPLVVVVVVVVVVFYMWKFRIVYLYFSTLQK